MPNCKSFLVTEAERKHVRRRASLVAVACFLPGQAKDLSAPGTKHTICTIQTHIQIRFMKDTGQNDCDKIS
jgi:hypothetical protein